MHGHASYLDAARKGIVNRMRTGKARQQRRMQVDHAVGKRRQQRCVHHAHIAGHHHVLAAALEQLVRDDLVGGNRVGIDILGQRERLDARALSALQTLSEGRLDTTSSIEALSLPAAIRSISACRLVPEPLMSTPILSGSTVSVPVGRV